MRNVFPRVNVTGRSLPALVLCVSLAASCESGRLPTAPSATLVPTPTPTPGPPVAAENVITLPAPTMPPTSAADLLVGRYTLEIVVARSGLRCEVVPEHVRRRSYTADIHQFRDYYAVKLYDAIFLRDGTRVGYGCVDSRLETGGVCHQFIMKRAGAGAVSVDMTPLDEWRGSEIWEIQDGRLIQLSGYGTGSIDEGRIVASGSGGVWYGDGIPATDASGCGPGDIAWTFMRR
jgi:hypothetical protein